jgi:hypothetical protein
MVIRRVIERLFDTWRARAIRRGLQSNDLHRAYEAGYVRATKHANVVLETVAREHLGGLDVLRAEANKWRNMSEVFSAEVLKLKAERRLLKATASLPELTSAIHAVLEAGGRVWIPPG